MEKLFPLDQYVLFGISIKTQWGQHTERDCAALDCVGCMATLAAEKSFADLSLTFLSQREQNYATIQCNHTLEGIAIPEKCYG